MKYVSPKYVNETTEVKDVITNSYLVTPETNEQGEVTKVTVTGYLSHLLGKM